MAQTLIIIKRKRSEEMSNKFFKNRKKHSGYTLIVVLIILMVLIALTYLFTESIITELAIARNNKASAVAFDLAEAGVQEAIYRIQNYPDAQNNFLHTIAGKTEFPSQEPPLINNGSYNVTIQNVAFGAANITSIGNFRIGLKTARREIRVSIAQATINTYTDDGTMYTTSAGGESTGDIELTEATINIYGGSITSGRDSRIVDSTLNVEGLIKTDRTLVTTGSTINCECLFIDEDPLNPPPACSENPGCIYRTVAAGQLPMIDFDGETPNSYKNIAEDVFNQYYESDNDFFAQTGFAPGTTKTLDGVVYINGPLNLRDDRTLIINGVLATLGTITIGKSSAGGSANGTITVNSPGEGQPSGLLAQHDIIINRYGNISGSALVYSGTKVDFGSSPNGIELWGGILSRKIVATSRDITIHFSADIINWTLNEPTETPVIEISHWEEEY